MIFNLKRRSSSYKVKEGAQEESRSSDVCLSCGKSSKEVFCGECSSRFQNDCKVPLDNTNSFDNTNAKEVKEMSFKYKINTCPQCGDSWSVFVIAPDNMVCNECDDSHGPKTILEEALATVKDRGKVRKHPKEGFSVIAEYWNAYLASVKKTRGNEARLTASDIGAMMILLKLGREQVGHDRDNLVDIAGFAECLNMIREHKDGPY